MVAMSIILVLGALSLVSCAPVPTMPPPAIRAAPASAQLPEGLAELTVFNVSGWTLIPGKQDLTDNGHPLVSLPRETYARFFIEPGPHELNLHSRRLKIEAKEGERYHVAAGYRPERSMLFPVLGDSVVIRLISESEADDLRNTLKAQ